MREKKLAQARYSQRRMQVFTSSVPWTSLVFWLAGMKQESLCAHTKTHARLLHPGPINCQLQGEKKDATRKYRGHTAPFGFLNITLHSSFLMYLMHPTQLLKRRVLMGHFTHITHTRRPAANYLRHLVRPRHIPTLSHVLGLVAS